ncbi:hypothetical protein [Iodobacter fluviatilis]|uniref:Uncharacterized protein n=1 Tax=Iodobacter fluviatilis TaxID=537 RepID=A0A377QAD1_9NEIS|nr:hypothetical protein [Iodobacter fluviatilis]TCU81918.1 hypothetical protein EV682_11839 [Iodobacter fluviatilis]STQ91549.1 Uncharacterised protein [Iodobacter fluviatilis]
MNMLTALLAQPRKFTGHGTNHEGEDFIGHIEIKTLPSPVALMLYYSACGADGQQFHSEATLLGNTAEGKLCLWPVMEELPFVLPHTESSSAVMTDGEFIAIFSSGPRDRTEIFREEITIKLQPDGGISYAHSWGMPGGTFEARSSCVLFPSEH